MTHDDNEHLKQKNTENPNWSVHLKHMFHLHNIFQVSIFTVSFSVKARREDLVWPRHRRRDAAKVAMERPNEGILPVGVDG